MNGLLLFKQNLFFSARSGAQGSFEPNPQETAIILFLGTSVLINMSHERPLVKRTVKTAVKAT
jgi:hypothetical protein